MNNATNPNNSNLDPQDEDDFSDDFAFALAVMGFLIVVVVMFW